jgi:hypothetical protein
LEVVYNLVTYVCGVYGCLDSVDFGLKYPYARRGWVFVEGVNDFRIVRGIFGGSL